jgi:VanZ family protein
MGLEQKKKKAAFHPLYFLFAVIMWILVIGWLAVIFSLSAETAEASSLRSQELIRHFANIFHKEVNEAFVRGCAHIFEFTVLSVLAYIAMFATNHIQTRLDQMEMKFLDKFKNDNEVYIAVSLWITALSASADEYHQIFVDGRTADLFDVFLDLCGAVIVMAIIRIVVSIYVYVKRKKENVTLISHESKVEEL